MGPIMLMVVVVVGTAVAAYTAKFGIWVGKHLPGPRYVAPYSYIVSALLWVAVVALVPLIPQALPLVGVILFGAIFMGGITRGAYRPDKRKRK